MCQRDHDVSTVHTIMSLQPVASPLVPGRGQVVGSSGSWQNRSRPLPAIVLR